MKKTAVIFLVMLSVLAAGILAVSCNSAINEEFGTVVLDFGGSERALDSNGLPILSTVRIKAEVTSSAGRTVQEYNPGREGNISLSLPVGERVVIKLSAYNASGIWSGTVTHTVEPGVNAVSVKLSKKIAGLNNLLFTQTGDGRHGYNLTLHMDGKEVKPQNSEAPYIFARDSLGRVYVGYKSTSDKTDRYTSEGDGPESITLSGIIPITIMNDFTTGITYVVDQTGSVYEIEENAVNGSPLTTSLTLFKGQAAIDNGRVVWRGQSSSLYGRASLGGGVSSGSDIGTHIKIDDCKASTVTDIFIRGDYVYVLFKTVNDIITGNNKALYSLGGVVRYNIQDVINNAATNPVKIGFADDPDFENGVLEDYDYSENFYGAVKVIGFDEDNIYIADDGFDAAYVDDYPRIVKNRNRIAALNMKTNEVRFTEAGSAKWYNEWKEWAGTKTVVWDYGGSSYYQVETGAENPLPAAFAMGLTDVFCYDAAGNLYVAKASPREVHRFELKDDGSYGNGDNKSISVMPDAMVVSVSSIAADAGKTILFYYQKPSGTPLNHEIKRLAWDTDTFSSAATASAITLADLDQNSTVTALAANKDGIFVAVKAVTDKDSSNEKYMIRVRKYAHTPLSGGTTFTSRIVTVVGETLANYGQPDKYLNENLNALYIKDGILYGLITKQKGYAPDSSNSHSKEVFIGGKLIKMGETASFDDYAGSSAVTLYENEGFTPETSGKFAPCRFIAIKPKKLVIASDGYYGKLINDDDPYNPVTEQKTYKKVFVFDIGNWANPDETVTQAGFSKDLSYCFGFMWN